MNATGIGASVKRKEDFRFITGKGRYVDDINRPGQAYAYFVRSPHAHATIDKIDASAALASPGVVAVFTGADTVADKIGAHICGWTVTFKGRNADESRVVPGARPRQGLLCRRSCRGGHRRDAISQARDAAEKLDVDYGVLPAVVDPASRSQAGPIADSRVRAQ